MMNIMSAVQEILNERGMNVQIELKSILKNNGCNLTGIQFRKEDDALGTVIYIDEMIHQVENDDITVEDAANNIIRLYEQNVPPVTGNNIMDMLKNTDSIIFQLVNTNQNKELLDEVPHREYLDLSIIYRSVICSNENGEIASSIIKNPLAEKLGLSEEDLFRFAAENTRRLLPPVIYNMNDFIIRQAAEVGVPKDVIDEMIKDFENAPKMYIITNKSHINGAASMLYEGKLHEIAESLGTDLYIFPSSIHEVIVIPADGIDPLEHSGMVSEINRTSLMPEERLSNNVYLYDKDLRKVSLASDSVVPLV